VSKELQANVNLAESLWQDLCIKQGWRCVNISFQYSPGIFEQLFVVILIQLLSAVTKVAPEAM
jgi:hypothetical protein